MDEYNGVGVGMPVNTKDGVTIVHSSYLYFCNIVENGNGKFQFDWL